MRQRRLDHFREAGTNWMTFKWMVASAERKSSFPPFMSQFRPPPPPRSPLDIKLRLGWNGRAMPVANCTFHSWILYFCESGTATDKSKTGKQRLQIYTIRPAAPNQPFREQRSRRGNVRTAPVHVKWRAHSGDVCARVQLGGKECNTERW